MTEKNTICQKLSDTAKAVPERKISNMTYPSTLINYKKKKEQRKLKAGRGRK